VLRAPAPLPLVAACRVLGPDSPARACTGPVLTIDGFPLQRTTAGAVHFAAFVQYVARSTKPVCFNVKSRPLSATANSHASSCDACDERRLPILRLIHFSYQLKLARRPTIALLPTKLPREPEEVELAVSPRLTNYRSRRCPRSQAARGLPVTGTDLSDAPILLCRVSALGKTDLRLRFPPGAGNRSPPPALQTRRLGQRGTQPRSADTSTNYLENVDLRRYITSDRGPRVEWPRNSGAPRLRSTSSQALTTDSFSSTHWLRDEPVSGPRQESAPSPNRNGGRAATRERKARDVHRFANGSIFDYLHAR
jgi:hypothetical protein